MCRRQKVALLCPRLPPGLGRKTRIRGCHQPRWRIRDKNREIARYFVGFRPNPPMKEVGEGKCLFLRLAFFPSNHHSVVPHPGLHETSLWSKKKIPLVLKKKNFKKQMFAVLLHHFLAWKMVNTRTLTTSDFPDKIVWIFCEKALLCSILLLSYGSVGTAFWGRPRIARARKGGPDNLTDLTGLVGPGGLCRSWRALPGHMGLVDDVGLDE